MQASDSRQWGNTVRMLTQCVITPRWCIYVQCIHICIKYIIFLQDEAKSVHDVQKGRGTMRDWKFLSLNIHLPSWNVSLYLRELLNTSMHRIHSW